MVMALVALPRFLEAHPASSVLAALATNLTCWYRDLDCRAGAGLLRPQFEDNAFPHLVCPPHQRPRGWQMPFLLLGLGARGDSLARLELEKTDDTSWYLPLN